MKHNNVQMTTISIWLGWIGLLGSGIWGLAVMPSRPIHTQMAPINCSSDVTILPTSLALTVTEGEPSAFYSITLCTEPQHIVTVSLHVSDSAQQKLEIIPFEHEVYFDQNDWNTPQLVEIKTRNDLLIEPSMTFTIGHSLSSNDENFNHPEDEVPQVTILLLDDERGLYLPVIAAQPLPTPTPKPMAQWQQLATTPPHVDVLAIHNGQFFAGDRSDDPNIRGLYYRSSCVNGAPFVKTQNNISVQDFSFIGQFGIAATDGDRIYYTNNSGASWQRTTSSMNQFTFAVAFTNSSLGYAGADDSVYVSSDNGVTWSKVNPADRGPTLINAFTYAATENILWIATYGDGVWKLFPGSNQFTQVIGGLANVDSDRRVWDILRRTTDEFYIATTNGVYKGDGVGNWSTFGLQGLQVLSLELVDNTLYAGVREGGLHRTALGSTAAWVTESGITPNLTVRDLFYDQSGLCNDPNTGRKALLAGTTSGIWVYR